MSRSKKKPKLKNFDFISNLPNDILLNILSLLPVDEAVRSSILSKRWISLWRNTSYLDLNVKHMIKPLTQLRFSSSSDQIDYILNLPTYEGIQRYSIIVFLILHKHLGSLKSCKFTHFPQKDFQINLAVLLERQKTIGELSLECIPLLKEEKIQRFLGLNAYGIFSRLSSLEIVNYYLQSSIPFGDCIKLKTLKLKRVNVEDETLEAILKRCYNLESLSLVACSKLKNMKIFHMKLKFLELKTLCVYRIIVTASSLEILDISSLAILECSSFLITAPKLRVFQSHNQPILYEGLVIYRGNTVLKSHEVLENLAMPLATPKNQIFGADLSSLMIDLDLKLQRATQTLSFVLRCCVNLENLEIITPVYNRGPKFNPDADLQYPMLWETSDDLCNCVHKTLKFVPIVGFSGYHLEADFVKHLITKASNMEKITIVCKCSKKEVGFLVPLQDQKTSSNLSIMVKIAKDKIPLIELNELFNNKS